MDFGKLVIIHILAILANMPREHLAEDSTHLATTRVKIQIRENEKGETTKAMEREAATTGTEMEMAKAGTLEAPLLEAQFPYL